MNFFNKKEPLMKTIQFLSNENGEPVFAVLPIATYRELIAGRDAGDQPSEHSKSLLSADGRYVRLPHGGPKAQLDVLRLADLCARKGISRLAIGKRAQALNLFSRDEVRHGLDPLIRSFFLPKDSPYRNTMQAVKDVVDALVETGIFDHAKEQFPHYGRAVNSLKVNPAALQTFLKKHGPLDANDRVHALDD